ncbi:DNA integrity scanning protein DisA nucleotide-binding domain protein [Candidatus Pacearchaeota archaeon]|nr:DNA integrity scanning protein DisA nucleotide-binding domain protein [Candidatus Pacearchaeota archaeon]
MAEEMNHENLKEIQETLLTVGLRIAKRGEGALFIVGDADYKPLVEQAVPPFKISENPKLLESLALMDGAVIIDKKGIMRAYGVMIKSVKTIKNFGTRHSAGVSSSKKGNLVVIVSEEDKKVKILREGKMIMQLDSLQKDVEKSIPKAIQFLESIGAGTLGVIGTSILAPTIGLTFLPGIIVFGSAYYIGKIIHKKFI